MFSAAATMLALGLVHTLPAIILLAGLTGFTGELYRPAGIGLHVAQVCNLL
jgi:hypothetical protein